jgi:ketosteroid isomerase-like protein
MADHPNVDVLRRAYEAFSAGDMDAMHALLADDVVWHISGRSPIAGDYHGKEQVFGFFGKLGELSGGTFSLSIHDILANDTHGVALVTASGSRNGKNLSARGAHVTHLRDGKITEFWLASADDQIEVDEFWA